MADKEIGINMVLRLLGAPEITRGMATVTTSGRQMGTELQQSGESARRGMDEISTGVRRASGEMKEGEDRAKKFKDRLDGIRDFGVGVGAAGVGILLLTRQWSQAAAEGDGIVARLKSILEAQKRLDDYQGIRKSIDSIVERGHMPDDDPAVEAVTQMASDQVATPDIAPLLEAAARNAEALKLPLEEVGTLFAKAYAEGSLTRLQRANILFSDQEKAAVDAAYAISDVAGRAKFMEVVLASTARSTGELGAGLTETQKAANDAARGMDDLQTALGEGVQVGEQNLAKIPARLLECINLSPEAAQGLGNVAFWAGTAGTAIGGILVTGVSVFSGLAQIISSWTAMMTALGPVWASFAAWGTGAWAAITAGASTAAVATWAALAPLLPLILAIAVGVGLVVAGMYLWIKADLDKAAADKVKGDAASAESLKITNANRRKHGQAEITQEEWDKMQGDTENYITPASTHQAAGASVVPADAAADAANYSAQVKAAQSGAAGMPAMPTMTNQYGGPAYGPPPIATASSTPVTFSPGATAAVPVAGRAGVVAESQARVDAIEREIEALEQQKEEVSDRRKPVIEAQIKAAKRRLDAARDQLKADEKATDADIDRRSNALDIRKNRAENEFTGRIETLEDEREKARKEGDAEAVRRLTKEIELSRARKDRDTALIEAASVSLKNADRGAAMRQMAEDDYAFQSGRADRIANKEAEEVKGDGKGRDARIRAMRMMERGGFGGSGGFLPGGLRNGDGFQPGGALDNEGFYPVEDPRAKGSIGQNARGNITISFDELELPLRELQRALGVAQRGVHRRG